MENSTKKSDSFSSKNSSHKFSIISFKSILFNKEGDSVPFKFSIMLCKYTKFCKKTNKVKTLSIKVGLLGLEPRLFWTKTRRVASYTIGQ